MRVVAPYTALALAGLAVGQFWQSREDPRRTNMGMFLYGYTPPEQNTPEVLFFKEGAACNVLVTKQADENVSFRVNGKVDGSSKGDMSMQLGLAYFPRFLNPDAKKVLVIGFGTGTTSGASLLFPDTHVTCCEIEPAIVTAAPHFAEVNHKPWESDRFTVVYDDARAYVQGAREKYDLILSEPSNPWIAGVSNLFTAEFYQIAREKLAPNGIFAQWVQTYSFAPEDYALIVRTICDVFPHHRLLRISEGDTILLAANAPLDRNAAVIQVSQQLANECPPAKADLDRHFATSDVAGLLLTRMLLDERGLARFSDAYATDRRNSDGNLQLEFRAARRLYDRRSKNAGSSILEHSDGKWLVDHTNALGCAAVHAKPLHDLATLFADAGRTDVAGELISCGLWLDAASIDLLADQFILDESLASEKLDRLLAGATNNPTAVNRAGVALWKRRRYKDAVLIFSGLTNTFPTSATAWTNLAINYDRLGESPRASEAHRRALAADPVNEFSVRESQRLP